ncbi:MMPL family transporter [Methylocystis parvus]|uniref:MMPL family transporter n=1 Tax=Methylocystis parvus TaxID=134 RepID=A0A6B8M5D8_9HYPH|nr:MMPL family transporter [Methylocystis parvus]QGM96543.1 MMPL family transporter [Methylocystis parvus]WBJ99605.1 MMPL family transporter [Methylocystis parvus OBBP]
MLEKLVAFCLRWPWTVVLLTLALTGGGVYLTVERFQIDTDTTNLFSPDMAWRKNQMALYRAFPQLENTIVVVIDAGTGEAADDAAARLDAELRGKPLMQRVWRPDDPAFFVKNGLLYLDLNDLRRTVGMLLGQRDILTPLAEDPSLRGLANVLVANQKRAAGSERTTALYLAGLDEFSQTFEATLAGRSAELDWEKLLSGGKGDAAPTGPPLDKRRIVMVTPVIDFSELQPGADAMAFIRKTAAELGITKDKGFTLRLTGEVPLAAEEFATLSENMALNTVGTLVIVSLILFVALRSPKLILAVLATLLAGLAITSGMGVLLIGRFNLISVAFAALFIGLGVDFGIQFATRYREERHGHGDLERSLTKATHEIGGSLTLAAVSLLAGFFCFLPTSFLGVAELGLIAGVGMIIAYIATLTFLPAAIKLLHPPAEHVPIATHSLAAVDHWIAHHRLIVLLATAAVVLAGMPALLRTHFDSNPMNLRDQKVESVATFLDLTKDPKTAPNKIETLAPSLAAARDLKQKIEALPEVDHVDSIDSLIPTDQDDKLALIERASNDLREALYPRTRPTPTDAETVKALNAAVKALRAATARKPTPQIARFAAALDGLAKASPETRAKARAAAFTGFEKMMDQLREALKARRVTPDSMPEELRSDWISAKGLVRLETTPKGDSNNLDVMTRFADAMLTVAPESSGAPVIISEAGKTVTRAFLEAGLYAFAAVFLILAVALRNPIDVALTLGPLVLAGIMSLQAAELLGVSLNFANIIALPLMFGVGVAFHIYYVIAWRKGVVDMLASSLTRAIFFSSLTTGTAFGSLFLSSHPGTASMGEFLTISLFFTLLAAFIIVPAFLGPPRHAADGGADAT